MATCAHPKASSFSRALRRLPTLTAGTLVSVTGRVIEFVPAADPGSPPLTELGESPVVEVRGLVPVFLPPSRFRR